MKPLCRGRRGCNPLELPAGLWEAYSLLREAIFASACRRSGQRASFKAAGFWLSGANGGQ
ncbi:hypothetical protein ACLBOM_29500 [Escherichia coli]